MSGMLKKSVQQNRRVTKADDFSQSSSGGNRSNSASRRLMSGDLGPPVALPASVRTTGGFSHASVEKPSGSKTSIVVLKKGDMGGAVCGGLMGSSGRLFCIKPDCAIAHRGEVVTVDEGGTVFVRKNAASCHVTPSIPFANVPDQIRTIWQGPTKRLTREEWVVEFDSVLVGEADGGLAEDEVVDRFQGKIDDVLQGLRSDEARVETVENNWDSDSEGSEDEVAVPDLLGQDTKEDDSSSFSSEGSLEEEDSGGEEGADAPQADFQADPDKDQLLLRKLAVLSAAVKRLEAEDQKMTRGLTASQLKDFEEFRKCAGEFRASLVGKEGLEDVAERYQDSRTLWELTVKLSHAVDRLTDNVKGVQGKRLTVKILKTVKDNMDEFAGVTGEDVGRLKDDLKRLGKAVKDKFSDVKRQTSDIRQDVSWATNQVREISSRMEDIGDRLEAVEGAPRTPESNGRSARETGELPSGRDRRSSILSDSEDSSDDGKWNGGRGDLTSIRAASARENGDQGDKWATKEELSKLQRSFQAQMDDLRKTIRELVSASDEQAIKFAGLAFKSIDECWAWVSKWFENFRFGVVMDVFVLFARMDGEMMSMQTMMTQLSQQSKLKIKTKGEAIALHALGQDIPSSLHNANEATSLAVNPSHLNKIPTYAAWIKAKVGVKAVLEDKLANAQGAVTKDIDNIFEPGSVPYMVASNALAKSVTFVHALFAFIEETYQNLTIHSKFTTAQAWSLVTQLISRLFAELAKVRSGASDRIECSDMSSVCANVLWTAFLTQDKMQDLLDIGFKNHPVVASEYVKFLATSSGSEKIDKTVEKVDDLVASVMRLDKEGKQSAKKSDTASAHVDDLKKKMTALERKVDAIAAKK